MKHRVRVCRYVGGKVVFSGSVAAFQARFPNGAPGYHVETSFKGFAHHTTPSRRLYHRITDAPDKPTTKSAKDSPYEMPVFTGPWSVRQFGV